MKIFLLGNLTQRHCSEIHWAATLEDLGHAVTKQQENEVEPGTLPALVSYGSLSQSQAWMSAPRGVDRPGLMAGPIGGIGSVLSRIRLACWVRGGCPGPELVATRQWSTPGSGRCRE